MVRPTKDPSTLKNKDLRIPVTESDKALVDKATEILNKDMAVWVRDLILGHAESVVNPKARPKNAKKASGTR
jgi:uncharacterized protein (DUF1778 family)